MSDSSFDNTLSDSQATPVEPLSPRAFDFSALGEYEASCRERCRGFWESDSGVLVHRRMRVAEVFAGGAVCGGVAGTGVVVNARIVGSRKTVMEHVKQLWVPDTKLIVVTYCETPEEQAAMYGDIHSWCNRGGASGGFSRDSIRHTEASACGRNPTMVNKRRH